MKPVEQRDVIYTGRRAYTRGRRNFKAVLFYHHNDVGSTEQGCGYKDYETPSFAFIVF
jgi:hypothetical protein